MSTTAVPKVPTTPEKPPPDQPPAETESKGKFNFPSAFTVLAIVAVAVWALAFIIPSGQYRLKDVPRFRGPTTALPRRRTSDSG